MFLSIALQTQYFYDNYDINLLLFMQYHLLFIDGHVF